MNKQPLVLVSMIALSVLASMITFTPFIFGQGLKFNLFDTYAPVLGIPAVIIVGISNLFLHHVFNLAAILHIFPVMFGAWYFGTKKKFVNLIPLIAILGFVAHPVGREVWYYSLFWLIPIITSFYKEKSVLTNALGATFTTHAVGGLLWIYFFNPPAPVWQGLIPIVILERLIFTFTSVTVYRIIKEIPGWVRNFVTIRIS